MPRKIAYDRLRAAGRCVACGGPNDQTPHVRCTRCYTPLIRLRSVRTKAERQAAYAETAWQRLTATRAAVEIACCGAFRPVRLTQSAQQQPVVQLPCCGRQFTLQPQEQST